MPTVRRAAAALALALPAALPLAARAQAPGPLAQAARTFRGGEWSYASTVSANGRTTPFGERTITVAPARYHGAEVWLLLDAQQNPMGSAADSLFLGRGDLASIRRVTRVQAPMGEMVLSMDFGADSVTGSLAAGGQSQPVAMANTRGAVAGDAVVLVLLASLPLADGWSATIPVLNPQARGAVALTLTVRGAEQVTVPAGTFDAWVLQAQSGPTTATYWVAKGGPVVKVVATLPQLGGTTVESVLKRAKPTP